MFDSETLFTDVDALIQRTIAQPLAIEDAITPYLNYCRNVAPDWSAIWDELSRLDFMTDAIDLAIWVDNLLTAEPLPEAINGLWFGLFNPCLDDGEPTSQLYLAGSSRFDSRTPCDDWACGPEYWPEGRYAPSAVLDQFYRRTQTINSEESLLGEVCLCYGYVASILVEWCQSGHQLSQQLIGTSGQRAVAFGHDSDGPHLIHIPT